MIVSNLLSVMVYVGRCAAVLFIDGATYFTDGVPNGEILDKFQNRKDRFVKNDVVWFVLICLWCQADHHAGDLSDFNWIINVPEVIAGPKGCCLV